MVRSASANEVNLPIKVLVADDSDVMRRTGTAYLSTREEVVVVGEANNFESTSLLIRTSITTTSGPNSATSREICDCRIKPDPRHRQNVLVRPVDA
jgi:hypothetical protein